MSEHRRDQSLGHGIRNWRESDHSVWKKLRLTARNNWRKARTGSSCCGHHGEPGC